MQQMIKISINMDISEIGFYGYIGNIDGYFYKHISLIIIYLFYIFKFFEQMKGFYEKIK